ncbi:putative disease resistance RPP13-like protein 1 [Morella rubra]|uniref:Putative disease resistance RPP13-like protein 1 n=1 Tax=Morella rubra TaxID=262757 RepID=A0A6A1WJZ4_9ROSI|nr:putative disease resistance RPP13-like protein 1 [Morella rubra]
MAVNVLVEDAEEKQATKPNVKTWLDELKDAVYDAEDILDKVATQALRRKLDAEFETTAIKRCRDMGDLLIYVILMMVTIGKCQCKAKILCLNLLSANTGVWPWSVGKLANIRGALSIWELQNVESPQDALDANLKNKKFAGVGIVLE